MFEVMIGRFVFRNKSWAEDFVKRFNESTHVHVVFIQCGQLGVVGVKSLDDLILEVLSPSSDNSTLLIEGVPFKTRYRLGYF